MRVITVTFISRPQRANPRLTFPLTIADLLGVPKKGKKQVALAIRKMNGQILFVGRVPLKSGTEIYGAANIKPALAGLGDGEEIWIEAWRPS